MTDPRMAHFPRSALALLGTAAATAPLAGVAVHALAGPEATVSAALGAALATISALAGWALLSWAMPRSQNVFLGAVVGGILGRMVVFCGCVALLVAGTEYPPAAFVGGLFTYYVVFQILEIRAVHRWAKRVSNPGR